MPERIARNLLMYVFYQVSAVAAMDEAHSRMSVKLFDTEFGAAFMSLPEDTQEIWLISNHPEGMILPYDADKQNLRRIRRMAPKARLHFFICGEDIGCREVPLAQNDLDMDIPG